MPRWLLRFDGLYEPRYKPHGIATFGFTVDHGDARMGEGHGVVLGPNQGGSANPADTGRPRRIVDAAVAEFGALMHGLQWIAQRGGTDGCPLKVEGDSRLVIETVAGRWKLESARLLPLRDMARELAASLGVPVEWEKISRERNAEPDALTRLAYHEAKAAHPEWGLGPHAKSARKA